MEPPFTAAPHHDVLVLLVQVSVLLLAARALGEAAQRLGQPSVVGEILAGIVLGPSLLSGFFPALGAWMVPESALGGHLLEVVSLLGALFLLLITGLETDLALIRRHARTAIGVSLGGVLVTFSSGFGLGWLLPDELLAQPGTGQRLVFSLFIATAMSISAIPVIAKVLMDLNLMRRDIGQTIIAAGMSDDTIGWILLSIVAGLAAAGEVDARNVLRAVGSVAVFMVVSFTLGRRLVKRALEYVQDEVRSTDRLVTLAVVLMLAWGAVTQALGLEAVLGAFVMGILLGQMPRLPDAVHQKIVTIGLAVFTPVFFGVAGLKVNIRSLLEPQLLLITLVVILIASGGKVVGTYLGARLIGRRDHWTALSFGAGLNARGAMEIIIATVGLELGILSQDMFSIIVVMALATSLMAPPALRWVLRRVRPEKQELERLRQEKMEEESIVAAIHRVLIPLRPRHSWGGTPALEARVVERMAERADLSITLLSVSRPGGQAEATEFLDGVAPLFPGEEVTRKAVESRDATAAILEEAGKDYDLVVLGATEEGDREESLFHPLVDRLVRMAPCATLVVQSAGEPDEAWRPARILVPTDGSPAARHAAELALLLANELVLALNVVRLEDESAFRSRQRGITLRQIEAAQASLDEVRGLGEARDVRVRGEVRFARDPIKAVGEVARSESIDLIVLGTDIRVGSDRLFLGPQVESLLRTAPCPVLVFNAGA